MATTLMEPPRATSPVERQSLCLSGPDPGVAIHAGEEGFKANLERYFVAAENNTAERLVKLKGELRGFEYEAFWNHLMEGMTSICNAQFAFVSKRILVDDHTSAVEMPLIGEVGSCLMGVALYWNDGAENKSTLRDYKYYAWNAPCSYMRHDKVFLCPEGLAPLVKDNPNQLPFECDAYLGIPLFAEGKCFAHFGMMWTKQGLEMKRDMSWGYVEMFMHSLEDIIADRLTSGQGFAKSNVISQHKPTEFETPAKVIPQEAISAAQSLKPYARSLSHELRTPMQGVVGMLDIMYATVQEQIEALPSKSVRAIFQNLKDSIETVQDSSRRAIEAADNVVHAYDLNMQVPDTPLIDADASAIGAAGYFDSRPKTMEESNIVIPHKRQRSNSDIWNRDSPPKIRGLETVNGDTAHSPKSGTAQLATDHFSFSKRSAQSTTPHTELPAYDFPEAAPTTPSDVDMSVTPDIRQASLREILSVAIQESLRVGGRPDSAISCPTPLGEKIEVRSRSSNGGASQKLVEWSVDLDVPELVTMDERDLTKLITAVFLNALKFTENGNITLRAKMSASKKFVLLNVTDTGSGIPIEFQPELFKPFAKEDHSITRSKEGLGLGLLVAKGLARRIGGDITLTRSSTDENNHGTDFEIRIPVGKRGRSSRATTPFRATPDASRSKTTEQPESPRPPSSPVWANAPSMPNISRLVSAAATPSARPTLTPKRSAVPDDTSTSKYEFDKNLAQKYPLRILVAEDNKINRKLLVNMLSRFGYKNIYEAFDGREAVRITEQLLRDSQHSTSRISTTGCPVIDIILMDLWMPEMDGYEATERILKMHHDGLAPIVLAVSADVTEAAVDRATRIGMQGYMTKPFKMKDLQRLIIEFCA